MKRILIIDDDENIRKILDRFFTSEGYTVDCAANGKEGLRLLEAESPDLVLTDIMMPEADGLEVVFAMRQTHPETPVFAMSGGIGSSPANLLPLVKKIGACKTFYKPVELSALLVAVKDELDG